MVSIRQALVIISSDLSHPALSSQQVSFSWRLNRLRPLARRGYEVVVVCAAGRTFGSRLRSLVENLKPSVTRRDGMVFLFPPTLGVPVLWLFASLLSTPVALWVYCRARGLNVASTFAASVAFAVIAKNTRRVTGGALAVDYGDPEYARLKGSARVFLGFLESDAMRTKHAVFTCIDPVICEYMKTHGVSNTLFLPPGGFWKNDLQAPIPPTAVEKTIVYTGHVGYPPYRLDLLIQAAPSVLAAYPNTKFVIVGDGKFLPQARAMAESLGVQENVRFVGRVSYEEAKECVAKSDIGVQLLDDMCLGTKVVDYFALGKPVLSCGSFHDRYSSFLKSGENCLLVAPDVKQIADGLTLLLADEELRKKLGENALRTIQGYDWDSQAKSLMDEMARA